MRIRLHVLLLLLLPLLAHADASVPTGDKAGAKDPTGIGRYEGSLIVEHQGGAFDEIKLPASILERAAPERRTRANNAVFQAAKNLDVEGRLARVVYLQPVGRSPLEVLRNYEDVIKAKGGEIVYECKADDCGGEAGSGVGHGGGDEGLLDLLFPADRIDADAFSNAACALTSTRADQRYALGHFTTNGAETTVAVLTYVAKDDLYCKAFNDRTMALVVVVEAKPREQKMVVVPASELGSAIASSGRIALYGILFDIDRSELKPASSAQLEQIAGLLRNDAALKLIVAGHTDDQGGVAHNLELSRQRADAVIAALTTRYGIAAERLVAQGMGSAAPVASNASEEGRAKNRRVELVKQ
jgi:outer membrane protein OmpA-like peptidoglycan-associated protein